MRVVLVLACLIECTNCYVTLQNRIKCDIGRFSVAVAEPCNGVDTTQCASEICSTGFVPTCVTNVCTCNPTPDPTACGEVADCDKYWLKHHCSHNHKQCTSGHCRCAHGHTGGK